MERAKLEVSSSGPGGPHDADIPDWETIFFRDRFQIAALRPLIRISLKRLPQIHHDLRTSK